MHKKQTGGSGQYAKIDYTIKPGEPGTGFVFESKIVGGNVPKEYIPSVKEGFEMLKNNGPLLEFPIVDFEVTLTDGGFHAVDTMAFEAAAKAAYRQTMPKCKPQLLEPIMKVDVYVPEANVGDVIGDLNRRRGMIKNQEQSATNVHINADAPLSEIVGYIGDLRSATSGRGQFVMEFSHYTPDAQRFPASAPSPSTSTRSHSCVVWRQPCRHRGLTSCGTAACSAPLTAGASASCRRRPRPRPTRTTASARTATRPPRSVLSSNHSPSLPRTAPDTAPGVSF
ncbi:MAG: hypothetical protein KDB14_33540 [Planctomycetales bacterium]|nr:hypothetical protein [Planctomycetales bacterium]